MFIGTHRRISIKIERIDKKIVTNESIIVDKNQKGNKI